MDTIKIKKGLDIHIPGTAAKMVADMPVGGDYAVKPTDYVGVNPRLLVAQGDAVSAGTPLFVDKGNEAALFVSPVSGIVKSIVRGEKRKLLAVVVAAAEGAEAADSKGIPSMSDRDEIVETMVQSGLWTLLRQRPFGIIPSRDVRPKAAFVSLFDSSPLPVDIPFLLKGREEDFQQGIDLLHTLAGNVHIALAAGSSFKVANAQIHHFDGPHPAGLTGTHIAFVDPVNKGETVWTVNAQDVATIGHYFRTGVFRPERLVALCGPVVKEPRYYRLLAGACIDNLPVGPASSAVRRISGDVLSGTAIPDGFLCASADKVSVLPEGDYYDFMGWLRPNFRKYSFSRTFLSGFFNRKTESGERRAVNFTFDTGRHGSVRPLFVTGEFEKLVPLDIYPMQLIKACIVGDIELMENLGIYEVEPEDLALCEFADTSKTEIQSIIRQGLEKIRKEC